MDLLALQSLSSRTIHLSEKATGSHGAFLRPLQWKQKGFRTVLRRTMHSTKSQKRRHMLGTSRTRYRQRSLSLHTRINFFLKSLWHRHKREISLGPKKHSGIVFRNDGGKKPWGKLR